MKKNIFSNDNMNLCESVEFKGTIVPVYGIMSNVIYIASMTADGTDFVIKGFAIPKNVKDPNIYAKLFVTYWYSMTLQGFESKQNTLATKKDPTNKDKEALEAIKLPIDFTKHIVDKVLPMTTIPEAIKTTIWAINKGAWKSADNNTRFWVKGGKGLADDIASYATGKMDKTTFKKQYCSYCDMWLKTSNNGDSKVFGDLFRTFSSKATDKMVSDLVNCYNGVKLAYNDKGIIYNRMRGQALTAQAVLQMLKQVYRFDTTEKTTKKVVDAEI